MKKTELRNVYLKKRGELTPGEFHDYNIRIRDRFFANTDLGDARFIHCFLPVTAKSEVDTWMIIREIWARYPAISVVAPVCDFVTGNLTGRPLRPDTIIRKNKWGIPEPEEYEFVASHQIDMVIAPLLVADLKGHRVGYGKGFYDKFFGTCRRNIQKIGLSMFEPVQEIMDVEPTDVELTRLITPDACYVF